MKKYIVVLLLMVMLTGCGNKKEVVSKKKIDAEFGTREVNETISKSKDTVEYEFETDEVKVIASMKYNKNFKYEDGKIKKDNYTISMDLIETDLQMFEQYKELEGYDKLTIDSKEAIKSMSDISAAIMVKVTDNAILYIMGNTNGRIVNIEMTDDKDYQDVIKSIKINVINKNDN